ncbi:hypothetical protein GCM10020295_83070 [Streptomyces cinereospinus]
MSVPTQHDGMEDGGGSLFDEGPQPVPFERVPPNDLEAEQSVLGGMLLSKDAIGEVNEAGVTNEAYYRPAHGTIHDAIMDMYGKGQPVDPITVAAYLTKSGDIERIGGASYLHTLVQAVPTAANAAYYAEIVVERFKLRRLIEAGTRIVQMGYAAEGEVADVVNAAQAEMQAAAQLGAGGGWNESRTWTTCWRSTSSAWTRRRPSACRCRTPTSRPCCRWSPATWSSSRPARRSASPWCCSTSPGMWRSSTGCRC